MEWREIISEYIKEPSRWLAHTLQSLAISPLSSRYWRTRLGDRLWPSLHHRFRHLYISAAFTDTHHPSVDGREREKKGRITSVSFSLFILSWGLSWKFATSEQCDRWRKKGLLHYCPLGTYIYYYELYWLKNRAAVVIVALWWKRVVRDISKLRA